VANFEQVIDLEIASRQYTTVLNIYLGMQQFQVRPIRIFAKPIRSLELELELELVYPYIFTVLLYLCNIPVDNSFEENRSI
jgi:hypothetical protein